MPGFHNSVVVILPFPFLRCCCHIYVRYRHRSRCCRWLAGCLRDNGKYSDPISTEERLRQLFAIYDYNRTEFSEVILQNNESAQRQSGETATEERDGTVETGHNWLAACACLCRCRTWVWHGTPIIRTLRRVSSVRSSSGFRAASCWYFCLCTRGTCQACRCQRPPVAVQS